MIQGNSLNDGTGFKLLRPVTRPEQVKSRCVLLFWVEQRLLYHLIHVTLILPGEGGRGSSSRHSVDWSVHWLSPRLDFGNATWGLGGHRGFLSLDNVRGHACHPIVLSVTTVLVLQGRDNVIGVMVCPDRSSLDVKLSLVKAAIWGQIFHSVWRDAYIIVGECRNGFLFIITRIEVSSWFVCRLWACLFLFQ